MYYKVIEVRSIFEQNGLITISITFDTKVDAGGGCLKHLRIIKIIPSTEYDSYEQLVGQYIPLDIKQSVCNMVPHKRPKSDSTNSNCVE